MNAQELTDGARASSRSKKGEGGHAEEHEYVGELAKSDAAPGGGR